MTLGYVLWQNLGRNPLRTSLTAAAFALPMAVFVAALSLVVALHRINQATARELRLAVRNKVSLINLVPEGTRRRIEELDPKRERLRAVCGMRWFGGRVPDTSTTLTSLAADADTFPIVYSDVGLSEQETAWWHRERRAAVAGLGPAERHGWKVGDRIVLESTVPPYPRLEFVLIRIMPQADKANFFYFRRDYLTESLAAAGVPSPAACNIFWIKCTSGEALRSLQQEIDQRFANSPDETRSEDENAFFASFTQAAGDIPGLMKTMAVVVVFVIALVAGNTMMMSLRERTRELAVFKAIGFQPGRIFLVVLGESLLLASLGALLGIVPTAVGLLAFPVRGLGFGPISALEVSPQAVLGSLAIALAVGLAAGLWPACQAVRLPTVDALRKVA